MGRLWIGFFSTSCLQNAAGSWSPCPRDTAGWGGTCGQWMPAEKGTEFSYKTAQSLIDAKLLKCIGSSEWWKKYNQSHSEKCICTDGKVLWSGSQQLRATTPASWYWQVKAVYSDKAPPWKEHTRRRFCVAYLFKYNVGPLRWSQPERSRQGLYDAGGSRSWPRVRLRPWLGENKQMCVSEHDRRASWRRRY